MHRGGATTMIIVLGLWLALLLPNAAAQEGEKCVSEMHGDFAYKTCASFCKSSRHASHCRYCKCKTCPFCTGGGDGGVGGGGGEGGGGGGGDGGGGGGGGGGGEDDAGAEGSTQIFQPPEPISRQPEVPALRPVRASHGDGGNSGNKEPHALSSRPPHGVHTTQQGGHGAQAVDGASRGGHASEEKAQVAVSEPTKPTPTPTGLIIAVLMVVVLLALGVACCYFGAKKEEQLEGQRGSPQTDNYTCDDALLPQSTAEFKSKPLIGSSRESLNQVRIRTLCVVFLCLQYSLYTLLRRYATGILKEDWSGSSVLGVGELIKLVISLIMISSYDSASIAPVAPLHLRVRWLLAHSIEMTVPAFVYLIMNMLGFASLNRIDAGTFAVIQQSKIFFTALFLRIFLGRKLSLNKWCALLLLVLGVLLISLESHPKTACEVATAADAPAGGAAAALSAAAAASYFVGVVAVALDSMLSGFATVYFEKVLKDKKPALTVWDRNLQLAVYSMLIYVPLAVYDHPGDFFHGWSAVTVVVAMLGALGGLLVALVIKYADGLAKNLVTASSIVLTAAASHVLFDGPMNTPIVLGSMIVIVSGYNYQNVQ